MRRNPRSLVRRRTAAAAGLLTLALWVVAACAGEPTAETAEPPLGTSVPGAADAPSTEPAATTGTSAPEARFQVHLKVAMPLYDFAAVSWIRQGVVFTIPDQSGDFGVGFRPDSLDDAASPTVVRLAVLDVRQPDDPEAVEFRPFVEVSLHPGEETTVPSPDGDGTLQLSLLAVEPVTEDQSTTK